MDRGTLWFSSQSQVDHLSGSHLRFPNKLGHGLNMLRLKQEKTDFTGWWYTYPSKNMKVRWDDYPQYMEIINVPNHQPCFKTDSKFLANPQMVCR